MGNIILCGHSLGGIVTCATATVLQLEERNQNASAVCFATFPTMCSRLSLDVEPFVTTFIFNRDSAKHLSSLFLGTFRIYQKVASFLTGQSDGNYLNDHAYETLSAL
jgi:hypothetical protein